VVLSIKVNNSKEGNMVRDSYKFVMVILMMDSLRMEREVDMVFILNLIMKVHIKVNGKMTADMDMVICNGMMDQDFKAIGIRADFKMELMFGQMDLNTLGHGTFILLRWKDKVL
jgi:hypothetical protein